VTSDSHEEVEPEPAGPAARGRCLFSDNARQDLRGDRALQAAVEAVFAKGRNPSVWKRRRPGRRGWYVTTVADRSVVYRWLTDDERRRAVETAHARAVEKGRPAPSVTAEQPIAYVVAVRDDIPAALSLAYPLVLALLAFALGLAAAPERMADNDRHEQFAPLFGTAAQVIATLFIALALEARNGMVNVRLAFVTVAYVGVGLVAAFFAGSPSIPGCAYAWLLAFTAMGGTGALASTMVIAYWSLTRRERRTAAMADQSGDPAGT
jgi:hypothetical protein